MSLIETKSDGEYLAWWRAYRERMLKPVVKAVTRRGLWSSTFDEPHTVPTYAEWRAANSQTFLFPHTVITLDEHMTGLTREGQAMLRRVLVDVAVRHGVAVEEILGNGLMRTVTAARQEAMWSAYAHTPMSLSALARRFKVHHTTVLHGIRAHAARHGLSASKETRP